MTAPDNSADVLAPCPFCGGEAGAWADCDPQTPWQIGVTHHPECPLYLNHFPRAYATEAEAIAAWNRRTESADDALLREARPECERHKQARWLAGNIVNAGMVRPNQQKWDGLYHLASEFVRLTQLQPCNDDAHLSRPRPARDEALEEAADEFLHELSGWEAAYPLAMFPEPDLKRAAELLKAGGMTLDAVSASNMRHAVSCIAPKARAAIAALKGQKP